MGPGIRKDYIAFGKPDFSALEIAAVTRVLKSGWVGMGIETQTFEQELADYVGSSHVISVNSCTSALFLSLLVHNVGPGDEVICPSLTWCSSATVAIQLGARVVFCDVNPETLCVTPETVLEKVTPKTKAVVVVHFGGLAADVAAIREVLPDHVAIVEDAAHSLGSRYSDSSPVGSSSNLTCFSFYANKNLASAEGGAIAVKDESTAERLRSLRQHGMPADAWKRFVHPQCLPPACQLEIGYKMNYTDLQACLARVQLRRQPEFGARRAQIANYYYERITRDAPSVKFQSHVVQPHHARHLFVVRLPVQDMAMTRDELLLEMRSRNIGVTIHYHPLHLMPVYYNGSEPPRLPNTDRLYREILTLPISASLNMEDAGYVMDHFLQVLAQGPGTRAGTGQDPECDLVFPPCEPRPRSADMGFPAKAGDR